MLIYTAVISLISYFKSFFRMCIWKDMVNRRINLIEGEIIVKVLIDGSTLYRQNPFMYYHILQQLEALRSIGYLFNQMQILQIAIVTS